MSRETVRLALDVIVEPGATPVTDGEVELTALCRLRLEAPPNATPASLDLAVLPLGPGLVNAAPVARALDRLRPGDRLCLPRGVTHTVQAGDAPADLAARLDAAFSTPFDTAAEALSFGREALAVDRRPEAAQRLLLVAQSPVVEAMEPLLGVASALTDRHLGLDVVTTSPAMDLGLMIRLANLGGGEVHFVEGAAALETAVRHRVERLTQQYMVDVRLALEFVPGITPGRMFRVSPTPIFLGNVRLTPTDRRLVLDPGPIAPGHEPAFLLTLTAPRRRLGVYRLVDVVARHRAVHRSVTVAQASVLHRVTDDPLEAGWVEAGVVAARDRAEPAGWVEEAARAFLEGDHRRVANTLERLARRMLEMGRQADAHVAGDCRTRYLRTGHLDRNDLNRLRRLVGQA
jgi:hypothetical protein